MAGLALNISSRSHAQIYGAFSPSEWRIAVELYADVGYHPYQIFAGQPNDFPSAYGNWSVDGANLTNGGSGFSPTMERPLDGLEISAEGPGGATYNFGSLVALPGAAQFAMYFTLNNAIHSADGDGLDFGVNVHISDTTHEVRYSSYATLEAPGSFKMLVGSLGDLDVSHITAFGFEVDPAADGSSSPYDITFNSLLLLNPANVPEPSGWSFATLALLCGFASRVMSVGPEGKVRRR